MLLGLTVVLEPMVVQVLVALLEPAVVQEQQVKQGLEPEPEPEQELAPVFLHWTGLPQVRLGALPLLQLLHLLGLAVLLLSVAVPVPVLEPVLRN